MKKTNLKSRTEDITIEEVMATEGLEHFTLEQAEEMIEFIKTFSGITYRLFEKEMENGTFEEFMRKLAK